MRANANAQPTLQAQAKISTTNLSLLLCQSSCIQENILYICVFKEFCPQSQEWCSILRGRHFHHPDVT